MTATTTATTTSGRVEGRRSEGISTWLGVPYAAPPVGPLRLRAPRPHPRWTTVRPAMRPAGAAAQPASRTSPTEQLGACVGEDCLYLNISSPVPGSTSPSATRSGQARPVLVWIHGGAFTSGSGALYDGRHLARLGDVVVVSVNYRLGVFGFADLGPVTGTDVPSNLGLRDVLAALEWVRENIAAFGGDPDRVTVAGESAGSVLVSLLLCAKSAEGLFRGAICQSGSFSLLHGDGVRAEVAERYARALGVGGGAGSGGAGGGAAGAGSAARLAELPTEAFLAAQATVDAAMHATTAAAPWFDGDLVPASLAQARTATRPEVALLAGSNRDEIRLFTAMRTDILLTRRDELTARLHDALGSAPAAAVLACYPDTRAGTSQLSTDLNFAMPTAHLADRHAAAGGTTYSYRFDAATPWIGAAHAADLVYLWDWSGPAALFLRGPGTRAKRALATRMREHWVSFVRDGHPGAGWPQLTPADQLTPAGQLTPADPLTPAGQRTLVFDPAGDHVEADVFGARYRAWAGADVMPHP